MNLEILGFDLDGTLVDSYDFAICALVKSFKDFNIKVPLKKIKKHAGARFEILFSNLNLGTENLENVRRRYYHYFSSDSNIKKYTLQISPESLKALSLKHKLYLISNSREKHILKVARKLKIKKFFRGIYGPNRFFTKEEALKEILKKNKVLPRECAYIGDRPSDVLSAKKAGWVSVAVAGKSSWSSRKKLKEANPDYVISKLDEIFSILR